MQIVYFTIAGIALYFAADWILTRIEIARGERFENRSVIFFAVLFVLAAACFEIIQRLTSA